VLFIYVFTKCFLNYFKVNIFPLSVTRQYPESSVLNHDKDNPHLHVLHGINY
jgi:hypothetical protein